MCVCVCVCVCVRINYSFYITSYARITYKYLWKNPPIRQIKTTAKVSRYTVYGNLANTCTIYGNLIHMYHIW